MTVLPAGTCTGFPSTSRFSGGRGSLIRVAWRSVLPDSERCSARGVGSRSWMTRHQTLLVVDVVLELVAEMLDEALDRQRGCVAERTDRAARDVVGDGEQQVEIFLAPFAVLDAIHHAPQPARTLAARRALPARLF